MTHPLPPPLRRRHLWMASKGTLFFEPCCIGLLSSLVLSLPCYSTPSPLLQTMQIYLFDWCVDCHVLQCALRPARPIRPAPRAIMRRSPPKNAHNINTEKPTNTQRTWRQFSFFSPSPISDDAWYVQFFLYNACCCLERSAIISKHN